MPVNETIELVGRLRAETKVDVAGVVVNRVLPELFGRGEEEVFDRLRADAAVAQLTDAVGSGVGQVLAAASLAVDLRRTRAEHLEHLRAELPSDLPLSFVPELFGRQVGLRSTVQVAQALGEELL
jgi:hypothetical protein